MAIAMTEEMSASLQRGLSEWWSEETEYIFQRIERWAALARGYNRLRSQRLSRGRLTMQEEQEPRWTISSNKIVIEDPSWSPRFHNLRRSHRRKSRNDENCRINCCGTFDYQSSCNLESNCLENYRYDHSIYFKTIGDIKSSKRDLSSTNEENGDTSFSGDDCPEWEAKDANEPFERFFRNQNNDNDEEYEESSKESSNVRICVNDFPADLSAIEDTEIREIHRTHQAVWPIVDLKKLTLDDDRFSTIESTKNDNEDRNVVKARKNTSDDNNNHLNNDDVDSTDKMIQLQINELTANRNNSTSPQKNHTGITRIMSLRKSRRNSRKVRQPAVVGDNNVLWPGVLLNYTKNVDNSALSPHHFQSVQVK